MVATLKALTPIFSRNNRPIRQAVRAIVDQFENKFTLLDVPVPKRRRIARSEEIIATVSASIQNEPNQSIPRRSQELGIAQTTLWRIMRKDLGLHALKIMTLYLLFIALPWEKLLLRCIYIYTSFFTTKNCMSYRTELKMISKHIPLKIATNTRVTEILD